MPDAYSNEKRGKSKVDLRAGRISKKGFADIGCLVVEPRDECAKGENDQWTRRSFARGISF
jgi:hypothetical protein